MKYLVPILSIIWSAVIGFWFGYDYGSAHQSIFISRSKVGTKTEKFIETPGGLCQAGSTIYAFKDDYGDCHAEIIGKNIAPSAIKNCGWEGVLCPEIKQPNN